MTDDELDYEGSPERVINRMALEDRDQQYLLEVVAPLVSELRQGKNFVQARQFIDLMRWFEADVDDPDQAMADGRFALLGEIEVIRVRPVEPMTITEIAEYTGLPRKTVHNWVAKTALKPTLKGGKKLYDLNQLSAFMAKRREE